jgi:hypothetical protein
MAGTTAVMAEAQNHDYQEALVNNETPSALVISSIPSAPPSIPNLRLVTDNSSPDNNSVFLLPPRCVRFKAVDCIPQTYFGGMLPRTKQSWTRRLKINS